MTKRTNKVLVKVIGLIAMGGSLLLWKMADERHSLVIGIIALTVFGIGFLGLALDIDGKYLTTPTERRERFALLFGFYPGVNKLRQSLEVLAWLMLIFGGPLILLKAMETYQPLEENVVYISIGSILVFFLILSRFRYFRYSGPYRAPTGIWVMCLLGAAFSIVCLLVGLLLFYNGALDQTMEVRKVRWLAKRASSGKDPNHYVTIERRHDSVQERELKVPQTIYDSLSASSRVILTIGKGAANIEWVRSIELVDESP